MLQPSFWYKWAQLPQTIAILGGFPDQFSPEIHPQNDSAWFFCEL